MKVENQWCVILLDDGVASTCTCGRGPPLILDTMGPFTRQEADEFHKQFNDEYDGSPFRAILRSLTLVKLNADTER